MEDHSTKTKWNSTELISVDDIFKVLTKLQGDRWLARGQSRSYNNLTPSIDRNPRIDLPRDLKLNMERSSIDTFRATAMYFADTGETRSKIDDIVTLMVLRHYGVPTRLLDWSRSPFVATYFAVEAHDDESGEIWAFDYETYIKRGHEQWTNCPETLDINGEFDAKLTAFNVDEPYNWFICAFYKEGFPRQTAQQGAYSMTSRFGIDHAQAISNLLKDHRNFHRYLIPKELKPELRDRLRDKHGIWRGSLFPDSAGAACTTNKLVFNIQT